MRQFLVCVCLLLSFVAGAQQVESHKLWEDNADAEIFVYHPAKRNQVAPAVLICPGGGYRTLAMNHEGHDMAKWYASNGFVAVVLKYRMPNGIHSIPLSDAEKAMSVIRANAVKWNLDVHRVGVIGSSAGGHLAASLSTLAADENRPNFAILYYPVISFDQMKTKGGSKNHLLGDDENNQELRDRYSLQKQVDSKTPKTLLLLSDDDTVVSPMHSIIYYTALKKQGIPTSMYMFPTGGHGWGIRYDFSYYQEVKDLIMKWLTHMHIK